MLKGYFCKCARMCAFAGEQVLELMRKDKSEHKNKYTKRRLSACACCARCQKLEAPKGVATCSARLKNRSAESLSSRAVEAA